MGHDTTTDRHFGHEWYQSSRRSEHGTHKAQRTRPQARGRGYMYYVFIFTYKTQKIWLDKKP